MAIGFSKQEMSDLLVTAWEGGSNYWVEYADIIYPPGITEKKLKALAWEALPEREKELWKDEGPTGRWPIYVGLPFLPPSVKWQIKFQPISEGPEPDDPVFLTPDNMRAAASKLLKSYPKIFARVKEGQYDALDADAWLQTALFDEVIFG